MVERPREIDLDDLLDIALQAADAGAQVALRWSGARDQLRVCEKASPSDLVSQADAETEGAIRRVLAERRPEDTVLGEETGCSPGTSDIRWAVDPIDGTTEFLYGRPTWAVSVAAISKRDEAILAGVVIEPAVGRIATARLGGGAWSDGRRLQCRTSSDLSRALVELNVGAGMQRQRAGLVVDALVPRVRDIRDCGSAASALAAVAAGRLDAYWGPGLHDWDAAAGVLLVNEAGGITGDLHSALPGLWPSSGNVLAANQDLHEQLRELLDSVWRDPSGRRPGERRFEAPEEHVLSLHAVQ